MKDFILDLYASPKFPIYLGIAIAVLIVIFFIVYILGQKDKKKLEMTQRIDNIVPDAFKDVSVKTPVEVPAQPVIENEPVLQQSAPQINSSYDEVVAPVNDHVNENISFSEDREVSNLNSYLSADTTLLEENFNNDIINNIKEEVPIVPAPNTNISEQSLKNYDDLLNSIEEELNKLESSKASVNVTPLPATPEVSPTLSPLPNVVSEEKMMPESLFDEEISNPVKEETPSVPSPLPQVENPYNNGLGIELPRLKK